MNFCEIYQFAFYPKKPYITIELKQELNLLIMKLLKGCQPITNQKEINELAHKIFGKRIELFDMTEDQIYTGRVESVGMSSFRFESDTGELNTYNYNDVEIRA